MQLFKTPLLALATLILATPAWSQDLFRSANTTTHSYNYVEAQYVFDVDASPPVLATLLLDITNNWSFKAEYYNVDDTDSIPLIEGDSTLFEVTAEAQVLSLGGLYHAPFNWMDRSDWIAGLMIGRIELEGEVPAFDFQVDDTVNFQEVYLGLRRTFSSRVEGEATVNYYRDSDDNETTADVKLIFRVLDPFDIALSGNELGGEDLFGIGLRYTW